MTRTWTIIGVSDVARSPATRHPWPARDAWPISTPVRLWTRMETVLLRLHQWGAHDILPDESRQGAARQRAPVVLPGRRFRPGTQARALARLRLDEEPSVNPNTRTREFSPAIRTGITYTISALGAPQHAKRANALAARAGSKPNQQVTGGTAAAPEARSLVGAKDDHAIGVGPAPVVGDAPDVRRPREPLLVDQDRHSAPDLPLPRRE